MTYRHDSIKRQSIWLIKCLNTLHFFPKRHRPIPLQYLGQRTQYRRRGRQRRPGTKPPPPLPTGMGKLWIFRVVQVLYPVQIDGGVQSVVAYCCCGTIVIQRFAVQPIMGTQRFAVYSWIVVQILVRRTTTEIPHSSGWTISIT